MADVSEAHCDRQKVWELIKDIQTSLLVTQDDCHRLRGRPMVALNKEFDGDLWLASRAGSPKLEEIRENSNVLLAYSEPKKQDYISVAGIASIVHDTEKAKSLWSEPVRVWFPKGPEDPNFVLIKVRVESAEFWDAPSSAWVYAYGYVKARVTGEPPQSVGENRVVRF